MHVAQYEARFKELTISQNTSKKPMIKPVNVYTMRGIFRHNYLRDRVAIQKIREYLKLTSVVTISK